MKLQIDRPFWIKLVLLAVFSLAYLPLAELKHSLPFTGYLAVLVGIHVYFVAVLLFGISLNKFRQRPWASVARVAAVIILAGALVALGRSPLRAELLTFLSLSFALHVLMISALHVRVALPVRTRIASSR